MATTSVKLEHTSYKQVQALNFSETGQGQYSFYIRGAGFNYLAYRILKLNGTDYYNTSGRGIRLTRYDTTGTLLSLIDDTLYDLYSGDTAKNALATALNGMSSTDLFVMTGYDWIGGNTNLNAAFATLNSWHWDKVKAGGRYPYACIGIAKLGILSEQSWSTTDSQYAELEWNYQDFDTTGSLGYGPELTGFATTHFPQLSYSGTGYEFYTYGPIYYTDIGLKDLEYVTVTCEAKVSVARRIAGGSCLIGMFCANSADSNIFGTSIITASEQWEKIKFSFSRNDALSAMLSTDSNPADRFYIHTAHSPDGINDGISYVRNLQAFKSGFSPNDTSKIARINKRSLSAVNFIESPAGFNPTDPDQYYKMFSSNRNLIYGQTYTARLNGPGTSDDDVDWFNRTLTLSTEKVWHWKEYTTTTGENMITTGTSVVVNPSKMYYSAIWLKNYYKTDGRYYYGCTGYQDTTNIGFYQAYNGTLVTNCYQWNTLDGSIYPEIEQWQLLEGWYLPYYTDNTLGTWYKNNILNKEFGSFDNQGFHPTESCWNQNIPWRFLSTCNKMNVRWLNYYNTTYTTKSVWALPILIEIDPLKIDSNGNIYSNYYKEEIV